MEEFVGELVIEDYPELENLYLRDDESLEKAVLRNLKKLKICEIWKCGTKELVIENCPQITIIDVRNNFLTNLEFIKDLDSLEELKIDGNPNLVELLEPYKGDWRAYQKDLQATNESTQGLLRDIRILERGNKDLSIKFNLSQKKYNDLKIFLKGVLVSLSQETQKELVNSLDNQINDEERKLSESTITGELKTKELILNVEEVIKSVKEIKEELETNLVKSEAKIQELEIELEKKVSLYHQLERDLDIQRAKAEYLKKEWKEALLESAKKESESNEREKWEQRSLELEQKLEEVREREYELKAKLETAKSTLDRAEDEVNYLRKLREKHEIKSNEEPNTLISQLKEKQTLTQQEISQVNDFLKVKQDFLTARGETIQELKQCLVELEKSFGGKRRAAIDGVGSAMSGSGGGAISLLTFGIPKAIGESIKASNNFSRIKLSKRTSEQFQIFLGNEENEITQLNQTYDQLTNSLSLEKGTRLFNFKYKIFDIVIKDGVWKSRPLTIEKMEKVIISLSENLHNLKDELEKETKELNRKFGTKEINLEELRDEQEELRTVSKQPPRTVNTRAKNTQKANQPIKSIDSKENKELKQKEKELNTLITSAKKKINRDQHDYLNLFLEQQEELVLLEKDGAFAEEAKDLKRNLQGTKRELLEGKLLRRSELEMICQKQIKITELKIQLMDLQSQSSRIEQSTSNQISEI